MMPRPSNKAELRALMDRAAPERPRWRRKNWYYYDCLERDCRFVIPEGASVLELGCGVGDLLASLRPRRGLGVDISPEMVRLARERHPDLEFVVGDAEDLRLEEKFEYVVLSDLVGHLDDIQAMLSGLHAVVTHDTRVIISYPNYLWRPALRLAESVGWKMPQGMKNWVPLEDIQNFLDLSDFQVVRKAVRLLMPFHVPWLSRFINRTIAKLPLVRRLCLVEFVVARPYRPRPPAAPPTVSVVVPCRNEMGNIPAIVERTPVLGSHTELIFVEGNSTDGTLARIEEVMHSYHGPLELRLLHQGQGKGKGDAVRKGFAAARGDILFILDADLTVPPEQLPKFYEVIVTGKGEFVNGSRLVYDMEDQAMQTLNIIANKTFGVLFSYLLGQRIRDTLCGTKVLSARNYKQIVAGRAYFGDFDPFGDFDLLFGAAKQHLKIVEVPVRYRARTYGSTNIQRFRHGWLLLKMCVVAWAKLKVRD